MIIDVIGLFGEPMVRSSLVLVVRRQQNKFHLKKGSGIVDSKKKKKRNVGGMFPFFELRPIRQKIVDIASPVHSLHTKNRRHMTTKKKISCKDRPKARSLRGKTRKVLPPLICFFEKKQILDPQFVF